MRIQTQVQGKTYKSQEVEEKRFTKDLHESNQAIQNETLVVRSKREVYNFRDFCNAVNSGVPVYRPSSNGCEIGRYYCGGYSEAVCSKTFSFGCSFGKVGHYGSPKCYAIVKRTKISEKITVERTTGCGCA